MAIKVTDKILSIPPYISTDWSHVAALHTKGEVLIIKLIDEETLQIPHLSSESIHLIFQCHAIYLEKEQTKEKEVDLSEIQEIVEKDEHSIRFTFGSSIDELGSMMQHNPQQANSPNLPPEILKKIGAITKILAPSENLVLPAAEPGCNCFHCQIARALNPRDSIPIAHDSVTEEDLHFQQWDISQTGDKLYAVTNRLDEHEKYNVYLGEPIGCTCGKQGCEHILAVLKS